MLSKEDKNNINDDEAETVIRSLINRMRFNYSMLDMIEYYTKCVKCRKKRTMKMRDDLTKHYKFKKAEDKLIKKLDVVTLV